MGTATAWRRPCVRRPALRRALRCRASSSSSSSDLESLRAKELRALVLAKGGSVEGLFDRESLLAAARSLAETTPEPPPPPPPPSGSCVEVPIVWREAASLYANVRTQQGEYAGLDVALADRGGKTAVLMLDSAASTTLVTPAEAQRLELPPTGVRTSGGVTGTGTSDASYQVALGALDDASSGRRVTAALNAVVMALPVGPDTSGLLGLDFLNGFDAVELLWAERPGTMRLHPKNSFTAAGWAATTRGLTECLLQPAGMGLLSVPLIVGGDASTPIPALLDTGAAFSTLNSSAASLLGIKADPAVPPMAVVGATGQPVQLGVADRDVSFNLKGSSGTAALGDVRPLLGDLPAFAALSLGGGPAALLGLDALLNRPRVVMSTATRRLLV